MTTESADIISELKVPETFDLGSFITSKVQFPTKDVKVILDIAESTKAHELASEIADLQFQVEAINEEAKGGITGGDTEALESEIAAKTLELSNLVDELNASALTFTLRGAAPKVWRAMLKIARRDFPIPKNAAGNDGAVLEATLAQNEFVDIETVKLCIEKITSPEGQVIPGSDVTTELVRGLYDALEEDEWLKLKSTAEAITFQVGAFDQVIGRDADFLPPSSASGTIADI